MSYRSLVTVVLSLSTAFAQPKFSATGTPAANLKVPKDFKVDLLYNVPKDQQGSWVAMCVDPKGRLITSDQYGKLYQVTLPALNATTEPQIEPIDVNVGAAQGLLYAFDSLYVMVNEEKPVPRGLYRVRDTNGDDKYDEVTMLRRLEGGGEHGPHAILLSPDKKSLYVVIGNQTKLTQVNNSKEPMIWSEDHLLPRMPDGNGFMKGVLAPGGWIARVSPDGKDWELHCTGFRNEYDAAFNHEGDLFAYDADMEWDLNTPWYRPTRILHALPGAEFGWRNGAGKWPAYYIDSFGPVVNVGPGSPTGVTFGYGAKFPAKYQEALFACDWSFGKMYAVHLTPSGSTYTGTLEEFITGQPLPLTDLVINPHDGAMYFAVGGRKTQSALYRVTYIGKESTGVAQPDRKNFREREKRRELEAFYGHQDPKAVKKAWSHLDDEDRAMRFAARIVLEWQDPADWREKALEEKNPRRAIAALVSLSRVSSRDEFHRKPTDPQPDPLLQARILEALDRIDWNKLPSDQDRLDLLRAYSLAFTRLGKPDENVRKSLGAKFEPIFPTKSRELNAELAPMLVYLETPAAVTKLMTHLRTAPTQEEQIAIARDLRMAKTGWTQPLREEYFKWFLKAANFKGGASMAGFMREIKADAVANLSATEKTALQTILEAKPQKQSPLEMLTARPVVKAYTVNDLAPVVDRGMKSRDFDRGRQIFGQAGCAACHRFENDGGSVGPDLTNVAGRFSVRDLLESIVEPSKEISDQYGAIVIKKKDGDVVVGRVGNLNGDNLMVLENMFAPNDFTNVKRADIESIDRSKVSMMPEGLLNYFKEDEIEDLVAFLLSRGDRKAKMFSSAK